MTRNKPKKCAMGLPLPFRYAIIFDLMADATFTGGADDWLFSDDSLRLSAFAWTTRDRPEQLKRGLEAWRDALAGGCSEPPELVVADDSSREAAANAAIAAELAASYPGSVALLDGAFANKLGQALGRELGAEAVEALAFALGLDSASERAAGRCGASRNRILLSLAGRAFAVSDDDILPEFRLDSEATDEVFESETLDPTSIRPFADESEIEGFGSPLEPFPNELYKRILGASYAAEGKGCERSVAALCFGSWGDSGLPSSWHLFSGRAAVDESAYADEDAYETAMTSRLVYRASSATSLGGTFYMGMHSALDARSILPPFAPVGRGEDGLWGAMLHFLHPDLVIAYPPLAVHHAPSEARSSSREEALGFAFRLNDLLICLMMEAGARPGAAELPYAFLGADLEELARRPLPAFCRASSEVRARAAASRIEILDAILAAYDGEPDFWACDVKEARARAELELDRGDFALPDDFSGDASALQAYIGGFGRLISAWPAIFEAAVKLSPELLLTARV